MKGSPSDFELIQAARDAGGKRHMTGISGSEVRVALWIVENARPKKVRLPVGSLT